MTTSEEPAIPISRRRFLAYSLGGLSAAALSACATPAPAKPPEQPAATAKTEAPVAAKPAQPAKAPAVVTPADVSVTYLPILALVPFYVAEDAGLLKDQGIKATFKNVNLYTVLPLIAKGDEDTGIMATSPAFINAVNSGLDVKAVADRLTYLCSSDNHLVVRKDLWDSGAVKDGKDLKGKTMAILAKGSATEYWHSVWLRQNGLQAADIRIVAFGFSEMLTALKTKAIDAAYIAEPQLTQALDEGVAQRLTPMYRVVPGENVGQIVFSGKFMRERTEVAQRWMNAYLQAVRWYQDPRNKGRAMEIVVKWTKVSEKLVEKMYGGDSWPWIDPNGEMNVQKVLDGAGKWMLDEKLVQKLPKVEELYDDRFVKEAVRQLGRTSVTRTC